MYGRDVPQLFNDCGITFQARPTQLLHRQAAVQREVPESNLVRRNEAAGPARDLHGESLRMARSEGLNHCPAFDGRRHLADRLVQTSVDSHSEQPFESFTHLLREVSRCRGNGALLHSSASSPGMRPEPVEGLGCPPSPLPAVAAPVMATVARGGVRRERRCEETARAEAVSFALDRSKFSWATSR